MHQASVMKLFTTFAALELLGPAFTFRTDVLATGALADGVLAGDLVLRGGGDPKLTYERLWQVAHHLRARGIREIRGDVILDRNYFAPTAAHDPAASTRSSGARTTSAPTLAVNFQALDFRFTDRTGSVRVTGEPDPPNSGTSRAASAGPRALRRLAQGLTTTWFENACSPPSYSAAPIRRNAASALPLALLDGTRYAEAAWRWVWSEAGGVLRGKVRVGHPPRGAAGHRHESEPLANLVRDINKFSNNVMARHIFLALSAEPAGVGGEALASARVVTEWLRRRGIDAPELVLDNGSGLSRNERASAATIAALLRLAWGSPVMPELAASLPMLSVDGTLTAARAPCRRPGAPEGRHARRSAGDRRLLLDRRGRRWIVVMVINHANAGPAQAAMDALVDWVYREERGRPAP